MARCPLCRPPCLREGSAAHRDFWRANQPRAEPKSDSASAEPPSAAWEEWIEWSPEPEEEQSDCQSVATDEGTPSDVGALYPEATVSPHSVRSVSPSTSRHQSGSVESPHSDLESDDALGMPEETTPQGTPASVSEAETSIKQHVCEEDVAPPDPREALSVNNFLTEEGRCRLESMSPTKRQEWLKRLGEQLDNFVSSPVAATLPDYGEEADCPWDPE